MNMWKEITAWRGVKPWESCLEIPTPLCVYIHREVWTKPRGVHVLNMPPMVEMVWGKHYRLQISPLEKLGRQWPATSRNMYREVHSCLEGPELPLITELASNPILQQRRWATLSEKVSLRNRLSWVEGWPEFAM